MRVATFDPVVAACCLLFAVALMWLYFRACDWYVAWLIKRIQDRRDHPEKYASERREPESSVVVRLTDEEVICERPGGKTERVRWDDLQRVEVLTTDDGPFAPDVFWALFGTTGGCAVPQGATGDRELLARLQALPGFDNESFILAMGSTENARFPCWRKVG